MIGVHLESGKVAVRRFRSPKRAPGFALIRLRLAGICNTDLELQRGYYGFKGTPGHEFVGEVVAADTPALVGRRVVADINLGCGACAWCKQDLGRHCPNRRVLGIVRYPGAFRELLTLPEQNLHVVPDELSDEQAVFVEPLAAAGEILDQVSIPAGVEVAVLGDGKLGLLIAQVLHSHGAVVHHYGKHRGKLAISERAGISVERVSRKLPRAAYGFVVDATGSAQGLTAAIQMTRPRGTLVMKSTVHGMVPIDTAPVIVNELTLVGSRCGRFAPAIERLKARAVDVRPLVADEFTLGDAPEAFRRAGERGVLKVLLRSR